MVLEGRDALPTQADTPSNMSLLPEPLGIAKVRRYVRIGGLWLVASIIPFNHTYLNMVRAVKERVFYVKVEGEFQRPLPPVAFAETLRGVTATLEKLLPKITPWTYVEFIESCRGHKRVVYQAAYDGLVERGSVTGKDAVVKSFIKFEKTDWTAKQDPVPRVISPRDPRYNLSLGRFIKKLEPRLFKSVNRMFGSPTIIKGYNAYRSASILRCKWDKFHSPVAVGLDASRFDQHVSLDALKWEHDIYMKCFPVKKHAIKLESLLDHQRVNCCHSKPAPDGGVSYKIEGCRMSGDMNTSLGNCLIMCCMMKAYFESKGITADLANNGDDCVVFLERKDLDHFSDGLSVWFAEMGFTMQVEKPAFEFEQLEFCQTKPVFDGRRWIMVRKPGSVFAKDTTMLEPYHSATQVADWMNSVGTGGLRLTGGLPILQNLYRQFVNNGRAGHSKRDHMSWYMRTQSKDMDRDFGPVTPEARVSFWRAFGICPDEQVIMERIIDQWKFNNVPTKLDQDDLVIEPLCL